MIVRIISSVVMLAILIPILICGGFVFDLAVYLIAIASLKEFLDTKEAKKMLPASIKIICYIMMLLILFNSSLLENNFYIDFRIIAGLFLVFFIPTILYHDNNTYSINDAFYLISGIFFLSIAFSSIMVIRNNNVSYFIYLILITIITDTYALFGGKLIGKHQMLKNISPHKTWEGAIIGTGFAVFTASIFFHSIVNPNIDMWIVVMISLFLSIISQFGDLFFSAIKRYFGKKDFSNLIPGHGGILDRLDSIIFVSLSFMFIMNII